MSNFLKLTDIIQIEPESKFMDMSKTDKHKFMDLVLQDAKAEKKRGLLVNFNLSSAGRRINNRIYSPKGQRAGLSSWMTPYAKPVILNHDSKGDAIGRFTGVDWVSLDAQAMPFFKTASDFMNFKDTFERGNVRKMYKELNKRGLLTNGKWPGLSALHASARIVDEAAIEKFLDGRYLTFSAGSHTDSYTCGICSSNWAEGDICEHRPGQITDEGLAVFFTGSYEGDEASVINMPANDLSQVSSMEFTDSVELNQQVGHNFRCIDKSTIYITDAQLSSGEKQMLDKEEKSALERLTDMDSLKLVQDLSSGSLTTELTDALEGDSHFETSWLIRIHDALHSQFDYSLKYRSKDEESPIPADVFKFHGKIHAMSMEKDFRGSLINGPLDHYDDAGESSEEYLLKTSVAEDSVESTQKEKDMKLKDTEAEKVPAKVVEQTEEVTEVALEGSTVEQVVLEDESKDIKEVNINWTLLDLAFEAEMNRLASNDESITMLDGEKRKSLSDETFCGPGRTLPLSDEKDEACARALIARINLSDNERKIVVDAIDARMLKLADSEKKVCNCSSSMKDLVEALKTVDSLKQEMQILKERLEDSSDKHATITSEPTVKNTDQKLVENPSVDNSDVSAADTGDRSKKLSSYEKKVFDRYVSIQQQDGVSAAESFISMKKRKGHVSPSFDPKQLMES